MATAKSTSNKQLQPLEAGKPQLPIAGPFASRESFDLAKQAADFYAMSTIVPQAYQKNQPNCFIAIDIAMRLAMDPLQVMQSLYVINGHPAWSAQFIIGQINTSPKFKPGSVRFNMKGEGMERSCQVSATLRGTQEVVRGTTVNMAMAKAEGWLDRTGSKWRTMPEQMLQYRAGSFFARIHLPERLLGIATVEEVGEIYDAEPVEKPTSGVAAAKAALAKPTPTPEPTPNKEMPF
jgi:hypothetical protein